MGSKGFFPLMLLLLLLLADLGYTEEHAHRHAHNGTTSAPPPASSRRHQQQQLQQQRLQQLQWAQADNRLDNGGHHHHLRHEQHLRAELAGNENRQPPPPPPKTMQLELEQLAMLGHGPGEQHHLRHHNRHHAAWEQRVFPELHQRQHRLGLTTAAPAAAALVTDAPLPQALGGNGTVSTRYFDRDGIYPAWTQPRSTRAPNWQQEIEDDSEDEDEDDDDDDDDDEEEEEDYKDNEPVADDSFAAELAKQMPRYSFFSQKLPQISSMEQDYDAYDQDEPALVTNRHPNVAASHTKAAAKRNIFDWLFKPKLKPKTSTAKPQAESADHASAEEAAFSNEQWNKIEHEHHLKQQQHQKELQALRDSNKNRNRNRNAPLIRARGGIDNEDADNSYSRNHIAGTLTAHKQKKLGTPEAVLNTQRQLAEDKAKARAHMEEVRDENICRLPQRRCLRIERETSKTYSPHCTSVYRCAEDSGCCPQRNEICAPKRTHKFERHFNVMNHIDKRISVEKLTLVNHTECHCVERGASLAEGHAIGTGLPDEQQTLPHFECPALFEKILGKDGKWRCDCSSSNDHCNLFKSGSEHFSLNDRKRIRQGLYKTPTCQYGPYIQKHGGCPTQHEQLPSYNALGMS